MSNQGKNQITSPRSGAIAPIRGGARVGAGRKPDTFKRMFEDAAKRIMTAEEMEGMIKSLLLEAKTGNVQAANALLDRMLGKVPQALQHQGDTGGPLRIVVEYDEK